MALPHTSLGDAVEVLRAHLAAKLQARSQPSMIEVGNLAHNAPALAGGASLINVLVTRIETDGSVAGVSAPWDPWLVRLHVLITAFSTDGQPSIGQNDLRLLGEVAAILHEEPILPLQSVDGIDVGLNIIPENISLEALNQLWAIQGDVGFRTSLAYEVSLVPIRSRLPRKQAPLAAEIELDVTPAILTEGEPEPEADVITITGRVPPPGPTNLYLMPATDDEHEHPHLRSIELADITTFTGTVWVESPIPQVRLVWDLFDNGWSRAVPSGGLANVNGHPAADARTAGGAVTLRLPAPLPAGHSFQLVLRAIPAGADKEATALPGDPVVLAVAAP